MSDSEWAPFRTACLLVGGPAIERRQRLIDACRLGALETRGVDAAQQFGPPAPIDAKRWAEWTFDEQRGWLQRPTTRKVPIGFIEVEFRRADIEKIVAPAEGPPPAKPQSAPRKRAVPGKRRPLADWLRANYPNGEPRPGQTVDQLLSEAMKAGHKVSKTTLERAQKAVRSVRPSTSVKTDVDAG